MNWLEETLDPQNWNHSRDLAHQMIDDSVDYLQSIRERPVWQQMPESVQATFDAPLPHEPTELETVYDRFLKNVLPYPMGNIHPRFWMWYMGSSNFTGAMGDFLAAIVARIWAAVITPRQRSTIRLSTGAKR